MIDRLIGLVNAWIYDSGDWMKWKLKAISDTPGFWDDMLARFAQLVPPNSDVLEIGPGVGAEAEVLLSLLNKPRYYALEPSKKHAKETERRLRLAGFTPTIYRKIVEELLKISHLNYRKFEAMVAIASLLHLRKAALPKALTDIRAKLENGAPACIVMLKGDFEGFKRRGLWFSYYQKEELDPLLQAAGFEIIEFDVQGDGKRQYLVYFLKAV